ncbi:GNAT family N-acetyltransferase [Amycolatopsis anabasis]|uniref:GNAT family N-acetyltransferase n=1 Tax=Amycolatopsis anabasis TaxID=1840409 RepID=UPI00131C7EEF|nr:GNAT family N-acetyltransferase [Amycolatopsis anabasis]
MAGVRSADPVIRRMVAADLPALRGSVHAALQDLHEREGTPAPGGRPSRRPTGGPPLVRRLLDLDPAGAWIATVDDRLCGAAMAGLREGLWYLAHLHVRPGYQGRGLGRRLLDAALGYGANARGGLLHSSLDPQAMRCYHRAGFALEPALRATGAVCRAALPANGHVRPGDFGDLDFAAEIDRGLRGAAHGPDLDGLLRSGARLLVLDHGRQRGYAVVEDEPEIVAATDSEAAAALLWAALAESSGEDVAVQVLRADQQWAVDVVHRAGLRLRPTGPLCRRGETGPLAPYLPHTSVL